MIIHRLAIFLLFVSLWVLGSCSVESTDSELESSKLATEAKLALQAGDVPLGKLPEDVSPSHYSIDLTIDPTADSFKGKVLINLDLHRDMTGIWMHGLDLSIHKIWLTGVDQTRMQLPAGSFSQKEAYGTARLEFGQVVPAGAVTLEFEYEAPFSDDLLGLHIVKMNGIRYATTQLEMISARSVFPGFDEPRFKTSFDISLTTPEKFVAITNTPETGSKTKEGWRTTNYARTPPLPTYLLAFVVGPWDVVTWDDIPATELRSQPIPLRGIAAKGNGKKLEYALAGTADIVLELERYFGFPYPFKKLDIVAVPDFAYGAMENAGLITYRDNLLLVQENSPASKKRAYISVHAHELAHQWFGNRVTMPWWNDIWLNESFATWSGTRAANAVHPEYNFNNRLQNSSIAVMTNDSLESVRRIGEEVNKSDDILNAFDGITYQKGGAVLRMFESFVGAEKFRKAIHDHLARFPYGSATAIDFFESVEQSTKVPGVVAAFSSFVNQRGVPLTEVTLHCDESSTKLEVNQQRYLPLGSKANADQQWKLPFCYAMQVDGQRVRECELISEAKSEISLSSCPDWVMPNGNGMGYYRWSLDKKSLANLTEVFSDLTEGEQKSFADSLEASVSAGKTDFEEYMAAIPAMIDSGNVAVATSPLKLWRWAHNRVGEAAQDKSAALVREYYSDLFVALGAKERLSPDQETLKLILTGFLSRYGNDTALRESLAKEAIAFLENEQNLESVEWDNLGIALTIAIEDVPAENTEFGAVVDRIQSLLHKTGRSVVRNAMLNALASAKTEDSMAAARALVFDASLKKNEVPTLLGPLNGVNHRGESWQWLTQNFDAIVKTMPANRIQNIPTYASQFCSAEAQQKVQEFFDTRVDSLLGARLKLTQVLEGISLCAGKKARHLADAERYFLESA